ncbi:MAG: 30S ribosomal protein S8 [Candidatus Shikimatogenerans sp. AspAUS03]|uniref:Small ribosomal subunit protein uS8 n=1 Tax=Candidatus Shikimatogenerans sp. AspAUS03 TaxID=3158563 RepID=A0AAU7QS54_9FLAO
MILNISLLINNLKNAIIINKRVIYFNYIKYIIYILYILKKEGYIYKFHILKNKMNKNINDRKIKIYLKYYNDVSVINKIKLISKPSKIVYVKYKNIPIIRNNYGICLLSTSKGIMSNIKAKYYKLGGKCLFYIY